MVYRTLFLCCKQVVTEAAPRPKPFIDRLRLNVRGGAGGTGLPKINGVGGKGGDVILEACDKTKLEKVIRAYPSKRVTGGNGGNSKTYELLGQMGKDVTVKVPLGVTVVNDKKEELADFVEVGQRVVVAEGGQGGSMKNNFLGRKGKSQDITLYLKLIADIGFVGFPNAGKSTLLRCLSRAKPKVADYPFTTIRPNIGVVEYSDFRRISLADLPGLIEGAHVNNGLGHSFLRHVERTSLLMFVVDINGFRLSEKDAHRNAFETVMSLNKELELYQPELLNKPSILVVNKMDTENAEEKLNRLKDNLVCEKAFSELPDEVRPRIRMEFKEMIAVAGREMQNVGYLKSRLRFYLDELYEQKHHSTDTSKCEVPKARVSLV